MATSESASSSSISPFPILQFCSRLSTWIRFMFNSCSNLTWVPSVYCSCLTAFVGKDANLLMYHFVVTAHLVVINFSPFRSSTSTQLAIDVPGLLVQPVPFGPLVPPLLSSLPFLHLFSSLLVHVLTDSPPAQVSADFFTNCCDSASE